VYPPIKFKNDFKLKSDVDGDSRCIYETAIGADESAYPVQKPKSKFLTDDTVCFGTPVTFANVATAKALQGYWWYLNGQYQTSDLHYTKLFATPGIDTVMLITENCGGRDTFSKIIVIDTPAYKPVSDFVADLNIVETGYPVQFYDLSKYCPVEWTWSVYPDTVYDPVLGGKMPSHTYLAPSHKGAQNPLITFDYPGKYKVCLKVKNVRGTDSLCKDAYIVVKPSQWMCMFAFPTVTKSLYGLLYDDGGPLSNYSNNVNCNIFLEPCASDLTFEFKNFNVSSGDYFRIYEGKNNQGKKLYNTTNYPSGMTGLITDANFQKSFKSNTGQMYIEWVTNTATVSTGWEGQWYGTAAVFPGPTADFDRPDTVCLGMPVSFQDKSKGDALNYSWDFDEDGFFDAFEPNPTYTFMFFPGTYKVTLQVDNCGGTSSKTKTIVVEQPAAAPTPDFTADIRKPVAGEDFVKFTDLTHGNVNNVHGCANGWLWKIYPDSMLDAQNNKIPSYTFVGGTSKTSRNPIIRFEDTGYYDITLYSTYDMFYTDSLTKNDYIYSIRYCKPTATNLNADIGISQVKLASINNSTGIGKSAYTNYSNDYWTYLDVQGSYKLTVERNSIFNEMNRKVWIDWNIDGDFEDAGEMIGSESSAKTLSWDVTFTVPTTATLGSTRMRVSTALGSMSNLPCGNKLYGEVEDYRVVIRPDGTPPEITLKGQDTVYIEQCNCNYTDSGATAYDNIAGVVSVTDKGTNLDCKKIGEYTYDYEAKDPYDNKAYKSRILIVTPDLIPPELSLKGVINDTINVYTQYTDAGYTANDTCSKLDKVEVVSTLDTSKLGDYTIEYTAYDNNGNMSKATRYISVRDLEKPTINLVGYSSMTLLVHSTFTDPGVIVTDNYCKNLNVIVDGKVDIHKLGTYTLTYSITDCNGNGPESVQRVVTVIDTLSPVISIKPPYKDGDVITLEVFDIFSMPFMTVTDNYNSTSQLKETYGGTYISTFGYNKAATTLGDYTYTYKVEDETGNSSMISYTVKVVDTKKPVITLVGNIIYNICRYDTLDLTAITATVSDNYDATVKITTTGTYFSDYYINRYIGLYTIIYNSTDNSGNKADEITRFVNVEECPKSISIKEGDMDKMVKVYPNPSTGQFMLEVELPVATSLEITVTDMLGQQMSTQSMVNSKGGLFSIDLSNQSAGVYFITVNTNETSVVKKVTLTK